MITPSQPSPASPSVYPGADESTPSRAQYFSWINNTNEGATAAQTLINLDFFRFLRNEYGMTLDIYAWDAGNLDGPGGGYGDPASEKFRRQFPNGWDDIARAAQQIGCRLGLWGGPDGFGDTPAEAQRRIDLIAGLCRDYRLMLLKFDGVCGTLRPEKQDAFVEMMIRCREFSPDLILLNHRLELGKGMPHATTFLWEGAETYIDVHMTNTRTAPHARAEALARGLPPGLTRLTEDHGVCLSSCLDYWEDDLILQAFNRCLILAPEIYGNPWLLRDDELPRLARIYNLHRRYRDILVRGMTLPESVYGPHAVARGNDANRLLTLRNLTWDDKTYSVRLDAEIGLAASADESVEVRQFHPAEQILGHFAPGSVVPVTVAPFRACLLLVSSRPCAEPGVRGCAYEVLRDCPGKPLQIDLLGMPGECAQVTFAPGDTPSSEFQQASLDGQDAPQLLTGMPLTVVFPGSPASQPWHRKLADLSPVAVPADAEALYEATCFRAEANALEVRSLHRSGTTAIPEVAAARESFFTQELFRQRGVWDQYLFDGRPDTFFSVWQRGRDLRLNGGCLRIDCSALIAPDRLHLHALTSPPAVAQTALRAEWSADLCHWHPFTFQPTGAVGGSAAVVPVATIQENGGIVQWHNLTTIGWSAEFSPRPNMRYVRIFNAPDRLSAFHATCDGQELSSKKWRANHLLSPYAQAPAIAAWQAEFILEAAAPGSYLCVTVEGEHGVEKAVAGLRIAGTWIGAAERAPSFPGVPWEADIRSTGANYTFYFPVEQEWRNERIEVVTMVLEGGNSAVCTAVWLSAYPQPLLRRRLEFSRR